MDQPRRCAVTGANGYVGSILCNALSQKDMRVVKFHRHAHSDGNECPFALNQPVDPAALRGIDALVHCAWDFQAHSRERIRAVNVEGSLRLFEQARAAGVRRIVFISSMSAFPGCRSDYGRAKLEIERRATSWGVDVVRPGLVYGPQSGGMVGSLDRLTKFPLLPIVGTGRRLLHLVHEEDLGNLVAGLCRDEIPRQSNPLIAAHPRGYTLKEILRSLAAARGKKVVLLPVPWRGVWFGLKMVELVGLRLRLRSDGLIGLMNLDPHPDFEAVKETPVLFRDFDTLKASLNNRFLERFHDDEPSPYVFDQSRD
jgi:nucleoside-diphosphate-sugar epimerase